MYLTLCNPVDGSPRGSSVHGIFQARVLEWVAIPSSRESTAKSFSSALLSAFLNTCSINSALFLGHLSCIQSQCLACAHLPTQSLDHQGSPRHRVFFKKNYLIYLGFFDGSDSRESACNSGDMGLIPGLGRSPGGGNGNPLQYFCLENLMDRGTWWVTVYKVAKSWT